MKKEPPKDSKNKPIDPLTEKTLDGSIDKETKAFIQELTSEKTRQEFLKLLQSENNAVSHVADMHKAQFQEENKSIRHGQSMALGTIFVFSLLIALAMYLDHPLADNLTFVLISLTTIIIGGKAVAIILAKKMNIP